MKSNYYFTFVILLGNDEMLVIEYINPQKI